MLLLHNINYLSYTMNEIILVTSLLWCAGIFEPLSWDGGDNFICHHISILIFNMDLYINNNLLL
jgi:hypothetical protein